MNDSFDMVEFAGALLVFGVFIAIAIGVVFLIHLLLTLPMRRAERARLFIDLIETALNDGKPVEETLVSISHAQENSLGWRFHLFAAWLEESGSLSRALALAPRLLPPAIVGMLEAGRQAGDLRKVLPACRQLLRDAISEARGAVPYIFMVTLFTTPLGVLAYVFIFPKLVEISEAMVGLPQEPNYILTHGALLLWAQAVVLAALLVTGFFYVAGARAARWFPPVDVVRYALPWRRKRMQRDFSNILAVLLDSGMPEPEAVRLAAESTANRVFRRRGRRVVARLAQGVPLTQAIAAIDDGGEFGWRLRNAFHGRGAFQQSLAGWHDWLDAKAFQEQQAAAQLMTTGLVLWNGFFTGCIVISVFFVLVNILNSAVLW